MNINPRLGNVERVGSAIIGAGLVGFALLGDLDSVWARVLLSAAGVILLAGGIGGT